MTLKRERRLGDRKKTQIAASIIAQNGAAADIKLIDISATGARVELPAEITITKHFKMLLGRAKIEKYAELVWRNATQAGVRFLSEEEMAKTAAIMSFDKERRLADREKTQITASIIGDNGMVADVKVTNISLAGACVDIPSEMAITKKFKLLFGRAKIEKHAELIWRTANQAGIRFLSEEEIDSAQKCNASATLKKLPLADLRKLVGLLDPQSEQIEH